nr:ATP-binding protein [uncultured Draconibacterium sp.]
MEQHKTKITSKSIAQSGLPTDYRKAIAEYIWNGFDAKATQIDLKYDSNETGYIFNFSISDNGEGICIDNIDETFGHFLDSNKQTTYDNDGFVKGKMGKGRFSFSVFSNKAIWQTRFLNSENEILQYDILISKSSQDTFGIDNKTKSNLNQTGTTVTFEDFHSLTSDLLDTNKFDNYLASEFGWFLFLNKEKDYCITVNGRKIDYWDIIDDFDEFDLELGAFNFKVSFLRWKHKIGDKYYYYLLNDELKEVYRKHTSFNNKAIDFHHSVYVESEFFNEFTYTKVEAPVLGHTGKNQSAIEYKQLIRKLNSFVFEKEKQFIREQQAEKLVSRYYSKNIFPKFRNNTYEKYRKKDLETVVKELYCVQPKIFQGLKDTQSKTLVGFLNLLLDTDQREHVLEIIENVIKLSDEERELLAKSLRKTNFSKITKLIGLLENRFQVVEIIKSLVFDLEKFATERDHIQKVVENNYWLFGEQYHLASADENFEIALNNYLAHIERGDKIPEKINDKKKLKRPDIFLCRQIEVSDPNTNEYNIEENIIVELKRPKIVIGKEQYSQIEDYMNFIRNEPRFNSQLRKWKFILIGKEVDDYIVGKYESHKSKGKRYLVESIRNYEIYAMTWDDIFKIFESRHKHLIDKLEFRSSVIEELKEKGIVLNLDTANELTEIAVNL